MFYSDTVRARMVRRMLGPAAMTATALSRESGISQSTLSKWLRQAGSLARVKDEDEAPPKDRRPQDWSAQEKLRAVVETEGLQGEALGSYLRRHGLHAEHLEQWRAAAVSGFNEAEGTRRRGPSPEAKRIKELERELRKKEAALAETAALLVLRKKISALWGDGDDDTDEKNEP